MEALEKERGREREREGREREKVGERSVCGMCEINWRENRGGASELTKKCNG